MHGIATSRGRRVAADGVHAEQEIRLDPDAKSEPGLREWLVDLTPGAAHAVAAFDTRLDRTPWLTGAASHGIARRMRRHGLDVVATESFLVDDAEGPLAAGELKRARAWGAELLSAFSPRADTMAGASA